MAKAYKNPSVINENTLEALDLLLRFDLLDAEVVSQLESDYLYLRKVEHFLQLLDDRQVHSLPDEEEAVTALGRRIEGNDGRDFAQNLESTMGRVHQHYVSLLPG